MIDLSLMNGIHADAAAAQSERRAVLPGPN
jgi:hypothetical protein